MGDITDVEIGKIREIGEDVNKRGVKILNTRIEGVDEISSPSVIFKVPQTIRDLNSHSYNPEKLSIGPFHHRNEKCQVLEKLKSKVFKSLVIKGVSVENCVTAISKVEGQARNYYSEDIGFNQEEFISMLVIDACFIIQLTTPNCTFLGERHLQGLEWDLILVENQIPWFILCKINDLLVGPGETNRDALRDNVLTFCRNIFPSSIVHPPKKKSRELRHLLDLIHSNFCPAVTGPIESRPDPLITRILAIPTASRLKDANVKFVKLEYSKDKSTTLFDIVFKNGILTMRVLPIQQGTESLFRNFIAYEQSLPYFEPTPVSDYAFLLDCLVNTSEDVQILSKYGIIQSNLSRDEVVVDFINGLNVKRFLVPGRFMYYDIFEKINKHQNKSWNSAKAVLKRVYFNNPWSYISFAAALLLLVLTALQVIFAGMTL